MSTSDWVSPSDCLWSSPAPIEGKAIVGSCYPESLKRFFLEQLKISPASLSTLVQELGSLAQRSPTVSKVNQLIWAINGMNPKTGDLETLSSSDFLPVRIPPILGTNYQVCFKNCQSEFAIIDRTKIAEVFDGHVPFLNFYLEEVRQLQPFLEALGLHSKYLSVLCDEDTACDETGSLDARLTSDFKSRAHDLLR